MDKCESVYKLFPSAIRKLLRHTDLNSDLLQEIRIRVGQPIICLYKGAELFLTREGLLQNANEPAENCCMITQEDIREMIAYVSRYSLYAFDEEMKQGYLTIPGGHRVGIAGKIVMDGKKIQCVRYISFMNIRISHEIKGCSAQVLPYLVEEERICHTLLISPPGCGKTTLLRDLIRQFSNGNRYLSGKNVGVVDERSEIAGSYHGIPQNDLGIRTDVLDCCPKSEGMMLLIRSMAPDVIAVDEIGDYTDAGAIEAVLHCGCSLLATVHGNSIDDIRKKPLLQQMINSHCFERYVVLDALSGIGHVRDIFDSRGTKINV